MHGISVLIPTKDRPDLLCRTLETVFAQTCRPIDVLISDDCSSDTTAAVIERMTATAPSGITVRGVRQEIRLGVIPNHIFLFENALHQYCCFLHDDHLFLDREFLSDAVHIMRTTPQCFVCIGNAAFNEYDVVLRKMREAGTMLRLPQYMNTDWRVYDGSSFAFSLGGNSGYPSYGTVVFDRDIAMRAGAFRFPFVIGEGEGKRYDLSPEEGLSFLYLLAVGNKIAYTNRCVGVFISHPQQASREQFIASRTWGSNLVLESRLCGFFLRQRRAGTVEVLRWFVTKVLFGIKFDYTPVLFVNLLRLIPTSVVLHITIQSIHRVIIGVTSRRSPLYRYPRHYVRLIRRLSQAVRDGDLSGFVTRQRERGMADFLATLFPYR